MCVYSMIADYYRDRYWPQPNIFPNPILPYDNGAGISGTITFPAAPQFTPEEVAALKELIKQAIKTDNVFKECDCESPEKVEWLKKFGIDVAELHKEVEAAAIEWDSPIDGVGYAYDVDGKRVGEVAGSGDGHFRAYLIGADYSEKNRQSLGDYKHVKQARKAVEKALDKK
jgi:hypothetical protein